MLSLPIDRPKCLFVPSRISADDTTVLAIQCTGERPQCAPCLVRGTQCRYETAGAETHSQARKRKYDELQNEAATLKELFLIISTVTEEQSREIVRLIRAGAEPESLLRHLQNGDLPAQMDLVPNTALHYEFPYISSMPGYLLSSDNVYLRSQIYDASVLGVKPPYLLTPSGNGLHIVGDDAPYLKPYHLAQVADDRFHNIMASRWTRVTSDNKLLAWLLDAYFMHAYPAFPAFQKDLFLDDMVSGRDRFCSELLVNAVLAHACVCFLGIPLLRSYQVVVVGAVGTLTDNSVASIATAPWLVGQIIGRHIPLPTDSSQRRNDSGSSKMLPELS